MATPEEFLAGLYATGGHLPFEAMRLARRYLAEHGVPPAPLDASAVQFTEFGIPVVSTPTAAASPPATGAEAASVAEASGGLVEAQEITAYGLSADEADALAGQRSAGIAGSAGHALYTQHARDAYGNPYIDASDYAVLHGFGLLGL